MARALPPRLPDFLSPLRRGGALAVVLHPVLYGCSGGAGVRSGSGTFFRRKRLIGRARRDPSEEKSTAAEVLTSADFCGHDDGCVPKEPSAAVAALAPEAPCGTRFWIRPPNPVTAFPHNVTDTTRKSPGGEMLRRGLCCFLVCPLRASLLRSVRNRGGYPPEACRGALYSVPVTEDLFRRLRRRDMVPLSHNEQTWWTVYGFFCYTLWGFLHEHGVFLSAPGQKLFFT